MSNRERRLISATKTMRALQREYFQTRSVQVLHAAKEAERIVDGLAKEFDPAGNDLGQQKELFDGEEV